MAADIAKTMAKADSERIKTASLTLEQIAEERHIQIKTSELFGREDQYVPSFGRQAGGFDRGSVFLKAGRSGWSY